MKMKNYPFLVFVIVFFSGCYSKKEISHIKDVQLNNYPKYAGFQQKALVAAWRDLIEASNRCRDIHNNYEISAKQIEATKLTLGTVGGVAGVTGSTLIAAGTGGVIGGIAAGIAGVISLTLGSSEKGPLSTSFYINQKEGIAKQIQDAAKEAKNSRNPEEIYAIASSLAVSCLADEQEANAQSK